MIGPGPARARAVPPAAASRPTSVRKPQRDADHEAVNEWFAAWCAARHISVRDLASILGVSAPVAARKLSGEVAPTLVDLRRFPDRYRHTLIAEFSAFVCSLNAA